VSKPLQVIVIGLGSAGDVHPNVGLALALRQRGHEVLLVAPSVFRSLGERTGVRFAALLGDDEYQAAIRDPNLWHPFRSFSVIARRLILPTLRPVYEIIEKHRQPGRTVVAAPGFAFGARIAQEKLGVPLATVHLQPIMFRSAIQPGCFGFPDILGRLPYPLRRLYLRAADRILIDPLVADETNGFRRELGLPPVCRFFNGWVQSPQLVIGLFPNWFASPAPDWPSNVALTGFPLWDESTLRNLSPELAEFLAAGPPPIVFTAGTAMVQARRFFQVSAEVCRITGRRAVFLTQFPEQLPMPLPSGSCHYDYVPFSAVLPQTALLVHHGGIGTTAQAIAAGIPQLVVPSTHDQPDNAARVRRLGVGDFLLPGAYTPANVEKSLHRLMSPDIGENCQRGAKDLATSHSLEKASLLIEELSMQHTDRREQQPNTQDATYPIR
jgi:UDP:flavonoid glycosyltransferase YjiC (YdhE family)